MSENRQILEGVDKERLLWFLTSINGSANRSSRTNPTPTGNFILQEDGSYILQEDGFFIELETA